MAGDPVYFFFGTPDADRAKRFFGELLGWEFSPGNAPEGHNIEGIQPPGGMFGGGDAGEGFRMYFEVDDLEVAREQVRDLGGDAGEPQPTDGGHFADCKDDQGFKFGIWAADGDQPAPAGRIPEAARPSRRNGPYVYRKLRYVSALAVA